jgi:hypothetical protein
MNSISTNSSGVIAAQRTRTVLPMEKVVYVLWRPEGDSIEAFAERLLGDVARSLLELEIHGLQVNVADAAVADAMVRLVEIDPQMEAVVSLWIDTVMDSGRRSIETVLGAAASRVEGYLVTESAPLRNTTRTAALGTRTEGFENLAFLRRPERLSRAVWLDAWQNGHSQLAIETQSTFGYTQNVVVRPLSEGAPGFDGIVEELFPTEALSDLHAFFDAVGDDTKLDKNMTAMGESTARFLQLTTKSRTSPKKRSGSSSWAKWPALGIRSKRTCSAGSASTMSCIASRGQIGSSSPAMTSVGHATLARPGSRFMSRMTRPGSISSSVFI